MEKEIIEHGFNFNRRRFLSTMSLGIGSVALGSLLMPDLLKGGGLEDEGLAPGIPHFAPKAKRVIYLFQNGAPSQQELFDYKPKLREMSRAGNTAFGPGDTAAYRHDGQPGVVPACGIFCGFQTIWPVAGVGE
jgi:hypothetical protein